MKKSALITVAAIFVVAGLASTGQAMRCMYPKDMSEGCVEYVAGGTGQPPCAYHEWPRVPCGFVPKAPQKIIMHGIKFETASSKIKPESYPILNETLDTVLYYPRKPVIITGYTDNRGGVPYNQKLSEARAAAVKDYFIQHGVAPWRIETVGMGEADPIATNNTTKGRALNRRIEVTFKKR
jgi:outer membrane protein OmpA-like peptidoglycan-associated protein